jgi:NAD(P)-dependent dehydrogenase (short-subunit alcohol dehydrogenase family)
VDLGLTGSAVVVTGGSKGMGRAIAEAFADDGARVAVLARGSDAIADTVHELKRRGCPDAVGLSVDLTDPAAIDQAFAEVGERWGSLNSLINTIGPGDGTFDDLDDAGWDAALQLGLMAAVRCTRAALPWLRSAEWARIVNFAAHSIQRQNPRLVAYTASKAAVTSFSKNLAKSLASDGILVNTISPGSIVTASFTEALEPFLRADGLDASDPVDVMTWIERTFHQPADLGRAGLPDEVASISVYLASRRNGYVTGANVNVDGGSDFM